MDDERTPAERRLLDRMTEQRDPEWVEDHAELILTQARLVGHL